MREQTKINLDDTDIAIVITQEGDTKVFIPNTIKKLSGISIKKMLEEIRKLELMFTELTNEVLK